MGKGDGERRLETRKKKDKIFKMDKPNTRFTPAKSKGGKGPGYHVEFFYSIFLFDCDWFVNLRLLTTTTLKASDTLEHQPMVWPVPYACGQPHHLGSDSWSALLGLVHQHGIAVGQQIGLTALCTLPALPRRVQSTPS